MNFPAIAIECLMEQILPQYRNFVDKPGKFARSVRAMAGVTSQAGVSVAVSLEPWHFRNDDSQQSGHSMATRISSGKDPKPRR